MTEPCVCECVCERESIFPNEQSEWIYFHAEQ